MSIIISTRGSAILSFFIFTFFLFCVKKVDGRPPRQAKLILVHSIFRHGDRTTDPDVYPLDPYGNFTYYPYGLGQLTNKGKSKEYNLGKDIRQRYNAFLGELYLPNIVDARSTDTNRTKMSLELVLAGLFPPLSPLQKWDADLNWQPIPYNYAPQGTEELLLFISCPNYLSTYLQFVLTAEGQNVITEYRNTLDYLQRNSGLDFSYDTLYAYSLYFGLTTETEYGLKLPKWTRSVYPETLTELAELQYERFGATLDLKRRSAGALIKKIVQDTQAKINGSLPEGRKIYLYSAHEITVGSFLVALGVFKPHVPPYGSSVAIEVYETDNNQYSIKIVYAPNVGKKPAVLRLPGCTELCPLNEFISIVEPLFPIAGDGCFDGNRQMDLKAQQMKDFIKEKYRII